MLEAEASVISSRTKYWAQGQLVLEDLPSLLQTRAVGTWLTLVWLRACSVQWLCPRPAATVHRDLSLPTGRARGRRTHDCVRTVLSHPTTHHSMRHAIHSLRWPVMCLTVFSLGTCEASWFDSISNRTSDSRFDSYWWSDSKFSNRPRCQSSFVTKRLVVVKFAFKVDFGSKISVQQLCLTLFMTELK